MVVDNASSHVDEIDVRVDDEQKDTIRCSSLKDFQKKYSAPKRVQRKSVRDIAIASIEERKEKFEVDDKIKLERARDQIRRMYSFKLGDFPKGASLSNEFVVE